MVGNEIVGSKLITELSIINGGRLGVWIFRCEFCDFGGEFDWLVGRLAFFEFVGDFDSCEVRLRSRYSVRRANAYRNQKF